MKKIRETQFSKPKSSLDGGRPTLLEFKGKPTVRF